MNIFFLDKDPVLAAQYLCNKHVVKMCLESAQLLSTTHYLVGDYIEGMYKPTHINHPCQKWLLQSVQNYRWLIIHSLAICSEYTFRYGKQHKSRFVIDLCKSSEVNLPDSDLTIPEQCMPIEYKIENPSVENVVSAYRTYYIKDKMKNIDCRWTKREMPKWIIQN